jgi:hypothetical protein
MTTAIAPRHAAEGSDELRMRLLSYGFTRKEIDDADRMPEQLILSTLSEASCSALELSTHAWWKGRARRFDLAFNRLRATGQIDFSYRYWHVVSVEIVEPEPPKKQVQRSLF